MGLRRGAGPVILVAIPHTVTEWIRNALVDVFEEDINQEDAVAGEARVHNKQLSAQERKLAQFCCGIKSTVLHSNTQVIAFMKKAALCVINECSLKRRCQ